MTTIIKTIDFVCQKGKHNFRTKKWWKFFPFFTFKNQYKIAAMIYPNCRYDHGDYDQYDWNKLLGVITSWHIHHQSIRVGWRYDKLSDMYELSAYTYNDGKRDYLIIGKAKALTVLHFDIRIKKNSFWIQYNSKHKASELFIIKRTTLWWWPFRVFAFPWFGGNKPAPHKMNIGIMKTL